MNNWKDIKDKNMTPEKIEQLDQEVQQLVDAEQAKKLVMGLDFAAGRDTQHLRLPNGLQKPGK